MQVRIIAVGRLRDSSIHKLTDNYLLRANKIGKNLKIFPIKILEVETTKALEKATVSTPYLVALDEHGVQATSVEFSNILSKLRDTSLREITMCIGGADGLPDTILERADKKISLGKMVWPHMLVRIMLSEQIYRAISIMNNTPYHRI